MARGERSQPEEDLRGGLALVEQALWKNPCNAEVLLVKGRAALRPGTGTARTPRERAEAERGAKEAFAAALHENPLLAREHAGAL